MQRSILLVFVFAFVTALATSPGCKKKDPASTGGDSGSPPGPGQTPGPGAPSDPNGPRPRPKNNSIPLSEIPYDPQKPEVKIDPKSFSLGAAAASNAGKEWTAKAGKLAEVRGVLSQLSVGRKTRREMIRVRDEFGTNVIACELLYLSDWRLRPPGSIVTVVGLIDVQDQGGGTVSIKLKDAMITAHSNPFTPVPQLTAEQLGAEYSANPTEFDKKWNVRGKYAYVTGTIKRQEVVGLTQVFIVGAGAVDLRCHVLNEAAFKDNPPKVGSKVVLVLECQGYDPSAKAIALNGYFVD